MGVIVRVKVVWGVEVGHLLVDLLISSCCRLALTLGCTVPILDLLHEVFVGLVCIVC